MDNLDEHLSLSDHRDEPNADSLFSSVCVLTTAPSAFEYVWMDHEKKEKSLAGVVDILDSFVSRKTSHFIPGMLVDHFR